MLVGDGGPKIVADPRRWRSCDPVPPMDSEQYSMSLYGFMPLTSKCNL